MSRTAIPTDCATAALLAGTTSLRAGADTDLAAAVTARVPGKVMLVGEYEVLDGGEAWTVAIDLHLRATLVPLPGRGGVRVYSGLWPTSHLLSADSSPFPGAQRPREADVRRTDGVQHGGIADSAECDDPVTADAIAREPLLAATAAAMQRYGCQAGELRVYSDLEVRYGVGSSSALRLAVLLAFAAVAGELTEPSGQAALWPVASAALALQRQAQQQASGYDIAAQLLGGVSRFCAGPGVWPALAERLPDSYLPKLADVMAIYVGGAGAPTGPVLRSTLAWLRDGAHLPALRNAGAALRQALQTTLAGDGAMPIAPLLAAVAAHRRVLAAAPTFPDSLRALLALPDCDRSWSFKTTGAGGEDAILVFGAPAARRIPDTFLRTLGWQALPAGFCATGASFHGGVQQRA